MSYDNTKSETLAAYAIRYVLDCVQAGGTGVDVLVEVTKALIVLKSSLKKSVDMDVVTATAAQEICSASIITVVGVFVEAGVSHSKIVDILERSAAIVRDVTTERSRVAVVNLMAELGVRPPRTNTE